MNDEYKRGWNEAIEAVRPLFHEKSPCQKILDSLKKYSIPSSHVHQWVLYSAGGIDGSTEVCRCYCGESREFIVSKKSIFTNTPESVKPEAEPNSERCTHKVVNTIDRIDGECHFCHAKLFRAGGEWVEVCREPATPEPNWQELENALRHAMNAPHHNNQQQGIDRVISFFKKWEKLLIEAIVEHQKTLWKHHERIAALESKLHKQKPEPTELPYPSIEFANAVEARKRRS